MAIVVRGGEQAADVVVVGMVVRVNITERHTKALQAFV